MIEVTAEMKGPVVEGKTGSIVKDGIVKQLDLAGQLLATEVKRVTREVDAVSSGAFMNSIAASGPRPSAGSGYENRVSTPLAYGIVLERGRRAPGPMPPTGPIELWVRRKGARVGLPQDDTRGLAFVIARKIARRGFMRRKGYKMFERGLENKKSQVLQVLGQDAAFKIAHKLNGE